MAIPIPPPIQRAATPRFPPVRSRACRSVTRMRQPEAPRGWPSAIAPPWILTLKEKKKANRERQLKPLTNLVKFRIDDFAGYSP